MPFVKLDTGILDSSLWVDRDLRDVFITALLMARPKQFDEPQAVIAPNSTGSEGWSLEPGWYGFVEAAGPGIVRRADVPREAGAVALEALASPDPESRSTAYEGRRMARVDGGWVILNYMRYRAKDHTAAERKRRQRAREKERHGVTSREVTQAEAEAEAEAVVKTYTLLPTEAASTREAVPVADVLRLMRDAVRSLDPELRGPRESKGNRALVNKCTKREGATLEDWRRVIGAQLESVRDHPEAWRYLCLSTITRPANWARLMDAPPPRTDHRTRDGGAYVPRNGDIIL